MFSWSIFILSLATLVLSTAVQTSFTPTLFTGAAAPTPFVSTMSQCMHSCVNDAADANQCDAASTCVCIDPKFQQVVAACLQSRCSFTEQEAALQLQYKTKCYREILADRAKVQTSPIGQQAGPKHNQGPGILSSAMSLEVGSGFVVAALVNIISLIL